MFKLVFLEKESSGAPEHNALNVRVQIKNEFELVSCSLLKTDVALTDDSVCTAIIPVAVKVEGALSKCRH